MTPLCLLVDCEEGRPSGVDLEQCHMALLTDQVLAEDSVLRSKGPTFLDTVPRRVGDSANR